jgi:hypothetical protein
MSAGLAETLILFLLPSGRPQRRLAGVEEEAYAMGALGLFLLPRGRPRPLFSATTLLHRWIIPVLAMVVTMMDRWKSTVKT